MSARTHYHAGQNMPGYLPMADEPNTFSTFADAAAYMIQELDRAGDSLFDAGETDAERGLADGYSHAMEALNLEGGPEWSDHLPSSTSEHDLGLSFWIVQCSDDECDLSELEPLFAVKRDGETLQTFATANEAFAWLLRHQGQSVAYATTYDGYSIEEES